MRHAHQLTRLQVISSGGQFPVSITTHGSLVYVLNARGGGSISGFLRVGRTLVAIPNWHRELGFNPNPTPEFTSTPAQVSFSPNGAELIVSTKGDGSGFSVFRVGAFGPAATPTVTTVPGAVPFGDYDGPAGAVLAGQRGVQLGERAVAVYVSNAGSADLTGYQIGADGTLTSLGNFAAEAGTVDAAASPDGKFLYVENGAGGVIDTFSIGRNGTLTKLGNTTLPGGAGAEGIAVAR